MADLKEHILETAQKLFLQKGFKGVTMNELVEAAGLTKGAFYHYFKSKEQVFEEVVLAFLTRSASQITTACPLLRFKRFIITGLNRFSVPKYSATPKTSKATIII